LAVDNGQRGRAGQARSGSIMKFIDRHPFADPDVAARKIVEIANDIEAVQDGRIYIERVNEPFLLAGGSGNDFRAGIERAVALGWLFRHESGTYVRFTDSSAALLASKSSSFVLQALSASAKVSNGEPVTSTAPLLE
jgi:hypothetical protein